MIAYTLVNKVVDIQLFSVNFCPVDSDCVDDNNFCIAVGSLGVCVRISNSLLAVCVRITWH